MPKTSGSTPGIVLSDTDLRHLEFNQLKELADQVGVGYVGLDETDLRNRLRFEGSME